MAEQRHHMIVITFRLEIHEQGRAAVQHQRASGDKSPFDAMRFIAHDGGSNRMTGIAIGFEIARDGGNKILNAFRFRKRGENVEFLFGKSQRTPGCRLKCQISLRQLHRAIEPCIAVDSEGIGHG